MEFAHLAFAQDSYIVGMYSQFLSVLESFSFCKTRKKRLLILRQYGKGTEFHFRQFSRCRMKIPGGLTVNIGALTQSALDRHNDGLSSMRGTSFLTYLQSWLQKSTSTLIRKKSSLHIVKLFWSSSSTPRLRLITRRPRNSRDPAFVRDSTSYLSVFWLGDYRSELYPPQPDFSRNGRHGYHTLQPWWIDSGGTSKSCFVSVCIHAQGTTFDPATGGEIADTMDILYTKQDNDALRTHSDTLRSSLMIRDAIVRRNLYRKFCSEGRPFSKSQSPWNRHEFKIWSFPFAFSFCFKDRRSLPRIWIAFRIPTGTFSERSLVVVVVR